MLSRCRIVASCCVFVNVVSSRHRRINVSSHRRIVASLHRCIVASLHRRIVASSHGHRQQHNTLRRQRIRMNSRIANPGTKMSPYKTDKSSNLRSLFAAYTTAKDCELAPTWNEQGEVERKTWGSWDLWACTKGRVCNPDGGNENDEYAFACSESLVATIKM